MKKKVLLVLFAIMAMANTAWAFSYTYQGKTLYYNISNGQAVVTSSNSYYSGDISIPSNVTYQGNTYSVISIGNGAFSNCSGLTSVIIPNSITSIGEFAFNNCSSLTSVTIPNSVTTIGLQAFRDCSSLTSINIPNSVISIANIAFMGCSSLTSVTIGNGVTTIGSSAFSNCSSLTSVTIGNGVTTIGSSAFSNCSSLTSITIPNSVTSIDFSAFRNCSSLTSVIFNADSCTTAGRSNLPIFDGCSNLTSFTFGNNVKCVPNYLCKGCTGLISVIFNADSCIYVDYYNCALFSDCSNLTNITFGNNVKRIPSYLCSGCSSLTSITIPNSINSIGDHAFSGCSGLTSVAIPNSVTSIGYQAFYGCNGLTSVTIGNGVTSIGNYAFYNCSGLDTLTVGNGLTTIGNSAFNNDSIKVLSYNCPANLLSKIYRGQLTIVTIGDSVTSIDSRAFYNCNSLASVTIGNGVTSIDSLTFYNCNSLASVTIGNGVTSIGYSAFYKCSDLTSATIPNSVTSIGESAFRNCSSLTSVIIPNSVISIDNYAFSNCSGLTYVTIGNGVTSIGRQLFFGCSSLTSVIIPNSVTSIGCEAFYNCSGLTSVTIGNGVTSIGSGAFYNCSGLTSVTIPNSVTSMGIGAFYNCNSLTSVIFNADSCIIATDACSNAHGNSIFQSSNLTSFTFGNNVRCIPEKLCLGCAGLTSIIIPNSVTSIGSEAFKNCSALDTVYMMPITPPSLGTNVFYNNTSSRVFVLNGCTYNNYYTTNSSNPWYAYRNQLCHPLSNINVNITTSDSTRGTAAVVLGPGNRIVRCDSTVVVQATVNYGYHFDHWSNGSTVNPDTVTLTDDITITAYFQPNSYAIVGTSADSARGVVTGSATVYYLDTVVLTATAYNGYHFQKWDDNDTNNPRIMIATGNITKSAVFDYNQYSISLTVDNTIHGTVSGAGNYNYLSNRTITATANHGYHFVQWNDGDTNNPRTITLTQDTSFTALFGINTYTIAVQSSDTIKGSVAGSVTTGYLDSITISATANYGYHFTHWNDSVTDNPRIVQVTDNATYTAYFDYDQFTLTVQSANTTQGNVSGGGNYNYLTNRTITATPNYGYHFVQWNDGDTNNPRTITLTQDTSFTALFGINTYTIAVQSSDTIKGSVAGSVTTGYLDSITISATANHGYHFTHWNDSVTDNPRIVQVTDNATYTAYFDYDQFTLTVQSANTTQGNVSGGGNYNYLSNDTIAAIPNYGYHFTYWNDGVTENPRTITLTQDTTFTANFASNQYTLTVNAGEHGTTTGSGTYNFGDTITIQAFPEEHYHFIRWNDGNTENPRQYRIEETITLTAFFAIDTYTVNVVSSDVIRGMVEASGTQFVYGTPCTVTATAYTGYTFAGWSNGITANPYTFAVISDVELIALFVEEGEEMYTVTVESADPTMGSVSGGGQAVNGGTLTIRAIPNEGYRFLTWNDGNTENPRTVTVTGNITYTAYFESIQGIGNIDVAEIKIYSTDGRIVVQGAEGMETSIYDLMGRNVVCPNQNGETPILTSGVYLVKVGTLPARKVVVIW